MDQPHFLSVKHTCLSQIFRIGPEVPLLDLAVVLQEICFWADVVQHGLVHVFLGCFNNIIFGAFQGKKKPHKP